MLAIPQRFRTPEDEASWSRTFAASRHLADHLGEAPALVLFLLPIIEWTPSDDDGPMDIGPLYASVYPAVQNFMLAARDLGIGTALTTVVRIHHDDLRRLLDIPEAMEVAALVPMGRPDRALRRRAPQAGRGGHPLGAVRQQASGLSKDGAMAIKSISDLARVHGVERRDKVALRAGDRTFTYGELNERTSRVANALRAEGVDEQDRVAFLDKNGPEYFDVLIGGAKANAVDVAVNWRLAPPEVAYIVNDSQSKVFFVGEEFVPVLEAIEGDLTTVKKIVVVGSHPRHESFEDWIARHDADRSGPAGRSRRRRAAVLLVGHDGAAQGRDAHEPEPVHRDGWVVRAARASRPTRSTSSRCRCSTSAEADGRASASPPGCEDVIVREVDPVAIAKTIAERRVTHAFLVPAVLQFMCMMPDAANVGLLDARDDRLRRVAHLDAGAEGLAPRVRVWLHAALRAHRDHRRGHRACSPRSTIPTGPPRTGCARRASRSAASSSASSTRPPARDCGTNEVGEIWIRTVQNMKGYWNLPDETAKTILDDGWLRSGDAGFLDEEGYLYIHDRVKDMIVSGGENIYPAEIENVLMSHPAVADAAVIGVPSDRWGETPKALIVKAADADPTEQELIDYCRERLAKFKCPTSVEWIDALPRNPSGKILKKDLRAPYWEGRSRLVN